MNRALTKQSSYDIKKGITKLEKQKYLKSLSLKRCPLSPNLHKYYTDVIKDIDPGILPLVKVFNNSVIITLYSCEGHFKKKKSPHIIFDVLPKRKRQWNYILRSFLNTPRPDNCFFTIYQRYHPKRYYGKNHKPSGPFVDWKLSIDLSEKCFKSKKLFHHDRDALLKWCTKLFSRLMKDHKH